MHYAHLHIQHVLPTMSAGVVDAEQHFIHVGSWAVFQSMMRIFHLIELLNVSSHGMMRPAGKF